MRVAIDFDGTIVLHEYPKMGAPVPDAIEYIKKFKEAGAELILWTMRSGGELEQAEAYCRDNGVVFDAVNTGIDDHLWTSSNKVYANIYIDDAAFGCPLLHTGDDRPFVNWSAVGPAILEMLG